MSQYASIIELLHSVMAVYIVSFTCLWYFSDDFSNSRYLVSSDGIMNVRTCAWKWSWPDAIYCPGIYQKGMTQTMKNLSHNSYSSDGNINSGHLVYEPGQWDDTQSRTFTYTNRV
jgi:hypothetical protein